MALSDLGTARYWRCQQCVHKLIRPGAGWLYEHCDYGPIEIQLTNGFYEGPDGNCPAAYWSGLKPEAFAADDSATEEAVLAGQRRLFMPTVLAALSRMPDLDAKTGYLVDLVSGGHMAAALAEECAREAGLDLDAP